MNNINNEHKAALDKKSFVCPHCKVLAQQKWTNSKQISSKVSEILTHIYLSYRAHLRSWQQNSVEAFLDHCTSQMEEHEYLSAHYISYDFHFAECRNCFGTIIWRLEDMIYPRSSPLPDPNEDMNDEIKELYREAVLIFQDSPRASAALLRLCVQKLCVELGEKGDLNTSIKHMVAKGLNERIQQALDYCRVIGNEAVHPGKINIEDDTDQVSILFALVNDIAQEMITKPKEMREKYASLPEGLRKQIDKRDGKTE